MINQSWDLSDMYVGVEDPQLEKDLALATDQAKDFAKKYIKVISNTIIPEALLPIIQEYEAILQLAAKPIMYASLVMSTDTREGSFFQKIRNRQLPITQSLLFVELELVKLDSKILKAFIADPFLTPYRHFLERQAVSHSHRLSETEESLIQEKDLTGRGAWIRLFDQEFASKKFVVTSGPKRGTYNESEVLHLVTDARPKVRQAAAKALSAGLSQDIHRLTYMLNMIAADKLADDTRRHFSAPESARHIENEIESTTVELLSSQVASNYPLIQDFYRFKKASLGLKEFHDYDRYAPLVSIETPLPIEQAQALVLQAFTVFSPEYGQAAQQFFDKHWIDVYPRDHKQGGAFCMYTTPDLHPYVLTNYHNSIESAFVVAHELGHGVHAMMARTQTYLNFDWPLTIAEMASVFGEMLLFDQLKNTLPTRHEQFALHAGMVDRIIATVFRQMSMYRFEQSFHHQVRAHGEVSPEQMNGLWRATQEELYGDAVIITPDYDLWWSYIPHFIHTPFYVYAYAVGEMLTLSLYARYKKEGPEFVKKYLELLSIGGSKSPKESLEVVGIDMNDPLFWQSGFDMVGEMIEATKKLAPEGQEKNVALPYKD